MPFTIITQGSFVQASPAVGVKIPLPSSANYFRVQNLTQIATTQAVGRGVQFEWYNGLTPADQAIETFKSNASNALNMTQVLTGGFTYVTTSPLVEAAVSMVGSAITNANPAAVTLTNTYTEGDKVRLYGTTGMAQIAGMDFTISSVTGAGFTLLGLPAGAFAAPATNVIARRISKLSAVEPAFLFVTNITRAAQAVVTVSTKHSYVVGQLVHFSVPSSFGMTQISQQTGKIIAVTDYTMTLDIDSSAFSAFAFPLSTLSPAAPLFATVAPAGQRTQFDPTTMVQTGYNFNFVPFHTGEFTPFMFLAAGAQSPAGSAGDVIVWEAFKMEN